MNTIHLNMIKTNQGDLTDTPAKTTTLVHTINKKHANTVATSILMIHLFVFFTRPCF